MKVLSYKAKPEEIQMLSHYEFDLCTTDAFDQLSDILFTKGRFDLIILFDDHQLTLKNIVSLKQKSDSYLIFFSDDYVRLYRFFYLVSGAYVRYLTGSLLELYLRPFYEHCYLHIGVQIKTRQLETEVLLKDIFYIEFYHRTCLIHTAEGDIEVSRFRFEKKLKEISQFLFSNAGNSTFINLHYVQNVNYSQVCTSFGMTFPLTRNHQAQFRDDYDRYVRMLVSI